MQSSFTKDPGSPLTDSGSQIKEYSATPGVAGLSFLPQATLSIAAVTVQSAKHWQNRINLQEGLTQRTLTHLTMVVVAILAVSLSNLQLLSGNLAAAPLLRRGAPELAAPLDTGQTAQVPPLTLPAELNLAQGDILVREAVPRTTIPDRSQPVQANTEIINYRVEPGDTISGIAVKFGLSPETIIWSNSALEKNPDLLSVGQELIILPVDGVYHQVGGGDTIAGIAGTYKTDPALIVAHPLNQIDPENPTITAGQWVIVPGGSKPFVPRTVTAYSGPIPDDATLGSGLFGWPASGSISNGFYSYHPALDIAGWLGAPVSAADSGYVVAAGWDNTGYGNIVVVDHGNGFQTVYAHLQSAYVTAGDNVAKGQQIGEMGSTGNSTGPHLHFEIRQGTIQRNPSGFLP